MFEPHIELKCYGYYNQFNCFCFHCNIAVECYDKTKGYDVCEINKLVEV